MSDPADKAQPTDSDRQAEPGDAADGQDAAQKQGAAEGREAAYELLQRGHSLLRDRHNAQAVVVLERAVRIEPRKGSILEALARALYNSRQYARAAETFGLLLEVDPSTAYGYLGLGLSLERLGRLSEARTQLRLAAAMNPASATYRRALARVESKIG
jgi:Flp pilus assembly protein TadD